MVRHWFLPVATESRPILWLVVSFIWNCSQILCKHRCALALPTNIIHTGEPGYEVRLAYHFAFFYIKNNGWIAFSCYNQEEEEEYKIPPGETWKHERYTVRALYQLSILPKERYVLRLLSDCRACKKKNHLSLCCMQAKFLLWLEEKPLPKVALCCLWSLSYVFLDLSAFEA